MKKTKTKRVKDIDLVEPGMFVSARDYLQFDALRRDVSGILLSKTTYKNLKVTIAEILEIKTSNVIKITIATKGLIHRNVYIYSSL